MSVYVERKSVVTHFYPGLMCLLLYLKLAHQSRSIHRPSFHSLHLQYGEQAWTMHIPCWVFPRQSIMPLLLIGLLSSVCTHRIIYLVFVKTWHKHTQLISSLAHYSVAFFLVSWGFSIWFVYRYCHLSYDWFGVVQYNLKFIFGLDRCSQPGSPRCCSLCSSSKLRFLLAHTIS